MTMDETTWAVLFRDADLDRVHVVATSILAMEYEAHVVDASTGAAIAEGRDESDGRTVGEVLVHRAELEELRDVLVEILEEQDEFDAVLEGRGDDESRVMTLIVVAVVAIVALSALARWFGWFGG